MGQGNGGRISRPAFAPSTIATRYKHLRQVFGSAVRDKLISQDPADGVWCYPGSGRGEHRMELSSPRRSLNLCRPLIRVSGRPGRVCLRWSAEGEASALKAEDVDFLRKISTFGGVSRT